MRGSGFRLVIALGIFGGCSSSLWAQASPAIVRTFSQFCSKCHDAKTEAGAPNRVALMSMSPESVYESMTTGQMKTYADSLSESDKKSIAEFLSGRPVDISRSGDAANMMGHCASEPFADPFSGPMWNGWGADVTNGRFQTAASAQLMPE